MFADSSFHIQQAVLYIQIQQYLSGKNDNINDTSYMYLLAKDFTSGKNHLHIFDAV